MKRLIVLCMSLTAMVFVGCAKDTPEVDFFERSYEVSANGGEMIIPVNSTGLDDVKIEGDGAEWLTIVEVIDEYEMTRALAKWDSGIKIKFAPNNSGKTRTAKIVATSFKADDRVKIEQPAL